MEICCIDKWIETLNSEETILDCQGPHDNTEFDLFAWLSRNRETEIKKLALKNISGNQMKELNALISRASNLQSLSFIDPNYRAVDLLCKFFKQNKILKNLNSFTLLTKENDVTSIFLSRVSYLKDLNIKEIFISVNSEEDFDGLLSLLERGTVTVTAFPGENIKQSFEKIGKHNKNNNSIKFDNTSIQ